MGNRAPGAHVRRVQEGNKDEVFDVDGRDCSLGQNRADLLDPAGSRPGPVDTAPALSSVVFIVHTGSSAFDPARTRHAADAWTTSGSRKAESRRLPGSQEAHRVTTMKLTFPRILRSGFVRRGHPNTHRSRCRCRTPRSYSEPSSWREVAGAAASIHCSTAKRIRACWRPSPPTSLTCLDGGSIRVSSPRAPELET